MECIDEKCSASEIQCVATDDGSRLLRLGRRLRNATIGYPERHPVILHHISDLLIDHAHCVTLYGGAQLMLRALRQEY